MSNSKQDAIPVNEFLSSITLIFVSYALYLFFCYRN